MGTGWSKDQFWVETINPAEMRVAWFLRWAIGFKEQVKGRVFWEEAYFQTPRFLSQRRSPKLEGWEIPRGRHI